MSTIMKELKAEISRLARREVRQALAPIQRIHAARRGLLADLRRRLVALQKEVNAAKKTAVAGKVAAETGEQPARFWITGKGVRAMRKRLRLTQTQFCRLVGVSIATVVNWERTGGKIPVRRKATVAALRQIRTMNKKAAVEILGKPATKKPSPKPKKKK